MMPSVPPQPPESPRGEFDRKAKRRLLLAAEIALVLLIIGLLVATWLPALIGAHAGH